MSQPHLSCPIPGEFRRAEPCTRVIPVRTLHPALAQALIIHLGGVTGGVVAGTRVFATCPDHAEVAGVRAAVLRRGFRSFSCESVACLYIKRVRKQLWP